MKKVLVILIALLVLLSGCEKEPEVLTNQWQLENGKYSYLDETGVKLTGWQTVDGKTYCFAEDGTMCTGWVERDGIRCYLGEDGQPQTGYRIIDQNAYILSEDGAIQTGWQTIDGKTYYLGIGGIIRKGWQMIDGERYYFSDSGVMYTGWKTIDGKTYCFTENGTIASGWITVGDNRYFLTDGQKTVGWKEIDGDTYYFNLDGTLYTGWLELDGDTYYFYDDGVMAVGEVQIEGKKYHFLANGKRFILVNPWNFVPDDFKPNLVRYYGSAYVDADSLEPLKQMLADCRAAGHGVVVVSTYRTNSTQTFLHNRMINRYLGYGYSYSQAKVYASRISAVPGTSEHQLGVAMDIVDSSYRQLDYDQAKMPTQKWLMENSWKYGFNLRYPVGKSDITGIIYEPWHYRYVGVELAKELYDRDVCLEEYFAELTQQQAERRNAKEAQ